MISLFLPCFTLASDYCPCNYGNYSSIFSFHINKKMLTQNDVQRLFAKRFAGVALV